MSDPIPPPPTLKDKQTNKKNKFLRGMFDFEQIRVPRIMGILEKIFNKKNIYIFLINNMGKSKLLACDENMIW